VQTADWTGVKESMEGAVARLLGGGLRKSREGIKAEEQKAGPKIQEAVDTATIAGAERASGTIGARANQITASTKGGLNLAGSKAQEITSEVKASTDHGVENIHGTADKASIEVSDTVGASRGAVQDAISKGIEKGKDLIDQAQTAVVLSEEILESRTQAKMLGMSEVEKALHERYEKTSRPDKTVEEVLEERYKPIDQRDYAVLRGL
jgi:altered-inheritance-of-mitochondria protein 5